LIVVTDTHPWIWYLSASPRLSPVAKQALSDPENLIVVPTIVMLEIKYLYQRKRIPLSYEEALRQVETSANLLLYPLERSVTTYAPVTLDIHDAIIVGTALSCAQELGQPVSLVSLDEGIRQSGLIPLVW
jgi:PIN domain nuclease of toxin-antitoxin system